MRESRALQRKSHAARGLHPRVPMNVASASPSKPLEPALPAEQRCAHCGECLEHGRVLVRCASMRRLCVDCAFDDLPPTD
jgi:hypothetical protein